MNLERLSKYIIIGAGIAGVLFLFPFFLRLFAPFLAAFFIATLCQKMVCFLECRVGLSRGISSAILVTLFVALILGLISLTVFQLFAQIKNLVASLPDALASFRFQLNSLMSTIDGFRLKLPPELGALLDSYALKLQENTAEFSGRATTAALNAAGDFAAALPSIMFFVVMLILGTFFFTKDYLLVTNFLGEIFPKRLVDGLAKGKSVLLHAFSSYMKAQLYLMLLTSTVVAVSLWVVGKENALLWGLVCGLVDALPVLGTAIILVPWSLVSLLYGDVYSFVSLMIIQALVFVIRQLAEPKIISRQIGTHPILTLISIYVGVRFFGITGVILAPIFTMLGVNLYISYKESAEE